MHFDCLAWFTARFLAEKGNAVGQTGSQSDSLAAFPSFLLLSYCLPAPICLPVFKKSFFFGFPVTSLNAALMSKEKSSCHRFCYSTFCSAPSPFFYYYYFYLFACYFVREIPTAVAATSHFLAAILQLALLAFSK